MSMPAAFIALGDLLRDPERPVEAVVATVLGKMGAYDPRTREPVEDLGGEMRKAWTDAIRFLSRATWTEVAERANLPTEDLRLQERYEAFKAQIIKEIKDYWLRWLKEHGGE